MKLTEALEQSPNFGEKPAMDPSMPQRQWLSKVGALLSMIGLDKQIQYKATFGTLVQYWTHAIAQIKGQVLDAIEELKLELELDGRSEIGNAYAPGDAYKFFADLKVIISDAENDILIVDPYFNGEAFDAYLSEKFRKYHKEKSNLRLVKKEKNLGRSHQARIKRQKKDLVIE